LLSLFAHFDTERASTVLVAEREGAEWPHSRHSSQESAAPKMDEMFDDELRRAALNLHPSVRWWMIRALDNDWFRIEPGAYEDVGSRGAMCPIVAAATLAGIWWDGRLLPGNPVWGTPERPANEVEDFAVYFDLCAEDSGTGQAIETVREALDAISRARKLAA
jgi:hypothetical protein